MISKWNDSIELSETNDLSDAHKTVLEMLGIVHGICLEKGLKYSLATNAMLLHLYDKPYAAGNPKIDIMMDYDSFCVLRDEVRRFAQSEDNPYVFVNYDNTEQFNTLMFAMAKRNRVTLPEERRSDEIYYFSRLNVWPVFFIADRFIKFSKAWRTVNRTIDILRARTPLIQRPLKKRIRYCIRTAKKIHYFKQRTDNMIVNLEKEMAGFHGPYRWGVCGKQTIIQRRELEEIEETLFAGQPCYISKHAFDLAARYKPKFVENTISYQPSDLVRKGGELLRRVQLIQLEMLVEFDRICRENGLRYNLAFGTLLGAVRHKGSIPWDDDIDVIMPIEDYLKFQQVAETQLDKSRFYLRTFDSEPDNTITWINMRRNDTVFIPPGRDKYLNHLGVWIDIFPVFHQANNRLLHWWQVKRCVFYRMATWAHKGADREKKLLKRVFYRYVRRPGNKKNYQLFMKHAMSSKNKNPYYTFFQAPIRHLYHVYHLSEDAFNDAIELEYEGHYFYGPRNYDLALKEVFGNEYMLYPNTGRSPAHNLIVDIGDICPLK